MGALTEVALKPLSHRDQNMLDRIEQLYGREVLENPRIGFNHYISTSCFLPYRDPGEIPMWVREEGQLTMIVTRGAAMNPFTKKPVLQGYPYGLRPRQLQSIINSEILRSGSREIYCGRSFCEFFKKRMKVEMRGGVGGNIGPLKEQFMRMYASRYQFFMQSDRRALMVNPAPMIEACGVWFSDDGEEWPPMLLISEPYAESLLDGNAVPVNLDALALITGPLEHDFYTWVTRRVYSLRPGGKPVKISWDSMRWQFGKSFADERSFRQVIRRTVSHLTKVVYRDLNISEVTGGWELRHSKLAVPAKQLWNGFTEARQLNMFAK